MRTILVTGAAGFIGSNFVDYIYANWKDVKIIVLDSLTYAGRLSNISPEIQNDEKRFQFVQGSINDRQLVRHLVSKVETVAHFAAESHVTRSIFDEGVFFETNVMGTHEVAAAVAANKGRISRFVHISTSEVYGTHSTFAPEMSEDHPLLPRSPYAASKAAADRLVYSYNATYGIPAVIIRPFNNYGPKQFLEKVVPRFITAALLNLPLEIHGDGLMTRDWIYVNDTCRAVAAACYTSLAVPSDLVVNIGTGSDDSVFEIANLILEMTGSKSPIVHIADRPGRVERHISSTERSRKLNYLQDRISLEEGMSRTIAWYQDHQHLWRPFLETAAIDIKDQARGLSGVF